MAANPVLRPVQEVGWRRGFGNLLRKELGLWFGPSRWWKPLLLWTLILNGLLFFIQAVKRGEPSTADATAQALFLDAVEAFFGVGVLAILVGAVLSIQDAIIGERQSGTAAWILSKPVARPAFVLTKFLAHAVGMTVLAILLQSAIFVAQTWFWTGGHMPEALPFVKAVGLLMVHMFYDQALYLMLSMFLHTRGAVTGIALGLLFAGQIVPNFLPWTLKVMPWILFQLVPTTLVKAPVPDWSWIPVTITTLLIPVFIGVAMWRFQRKRQILPTWEAAAPRETILLRKPGRVVSCRVKGWRSCGALESRTTEPAASA